GGEFDFSVDSITDPGDDTISSYAIDWRDGTPEETYNGAVPLQTTFSHKYSQQGDDALLYGTDENGEHPLAHLPFEFTGPARIPGFSGPNNDPPKVLLRSDGSIANRFLTRSFGLQVADAATRDGTVYMTGAQGTGNDQRLYVKALRNTGVEVEPGGFGDRLA